MDPRFFTDNLYYTEDTNLLMFSTSGLLNLVVGIAQGFRAFAYQSYPPAYPHQVEQVDHEHHVLAQGHLILLIAQQVVYGNPELARELANQEKAIEIMVAALMDFRDWSVNPLRRTIMTPPVIDLEFIKRFISACEDNKSVPTT